MKKPSEYDGEGLLVEKSWPPRTIHKGQCLPETYLLQSLLHCQGYSVLINGIFGNSLENKVKAFQNVHRIKADGVVGPKTWDALMMLPNGH